MKIKVEFYAAGLPYSQTLHVIAPSLEAARKFIQREAKGCEIASITETSDLAVYAQSDESGQRIS